jgi:hypothetical protein
MAFGILKSPPSTSYGDKLDLNIWRNEQDNNDRDSGLVAIRGCRNKAINLVYNDESWVNTGTTDENARIDKT